MKKLDQSNKLTFHKVSLLELNANELQNVNGGTSTYMPSIVTLLPIIIPTGGEDGQPIVLSKTN